MCICLAVFIDINSKFDKPIGTFDPNDSKSRSLSRPVMHYAFGEARPE
jgi:hypothetical protein